jgi:hypothetical protein
MTAMGDSTFTGATSSTGTGGFGAGFSPVGFNTQTVTIPGVATSGGGKKGKTTISAPTTMTTVTPYSTGPSGGFGSGSGELNISGMAAGTMAAGTGYSTGTSTGTADNFGGGTGGAGNYFGSAGGTGSGAGSGTGVGGGSTKVDTAGVFTGTGTATGNFNNGGSGIFGATGAIGFPGFP